MTIDADFFIDNLELVPHPEGGYYKEIYRSDGIISADALPGRYNNNEDKY